MKMTSIPLTDFAWIYISDSPLQLHIAPMKQSSTSITAEIRWGM